MWGRGESQHWGAYTPQAVGSSPVSCECYAANQFCKAICPFSPAGPRRFNLIMPEQCQKIAGEAQISASWAAGGLARACGDRRVGAQPGQHDEVAQVSFPPICALSPPPPEPECSCGPSSLPGRKSKTAPTPSNAPPWNGAPGWGLGLQHGGPAQSSLGGREVSVKK